VDKVTIPEQKLSDLRLIALRQATAALAGTVDVTHVATVVVVEVEVQALLQQPM